MKRIPLCLIFILSLFVLSGCKDASGGEHEWQTPAPDGFSQSPESLDEISDEDFLSLLDSYENNIHQSLYEINGEAYGRIISSSESAEDAVKVCTRHFTDNRYPQSINTVTECKVIYESDMLYGINVKWQVTDNGRFDGQFEENVISIKRDIADITVKNVVYDDVESYRICSNTKEQISQTVFYVFHNRYFGKTILDYEMLPCGDEYRITIWSYDVSFGDWGVKNEYHLFKNTIVVDMINGDIYFEEQTILKTVYR